MMRTLGQNGLNFIGNKYKELKNSLLNKVDKIDGKGLSTNDYDSTAKGKVDAIPTNPKYTDTTYSNATTSKSGLMSSSDKSKLDGMSIKQHSENGVHFFRVGDLVTVIVQTYGNGRNTNVAPIPDDFIPKPGILIVDGFITNQQTGTSSRKEIMAGKDARGYYIFSRSVVETYEFISAQLVYMAN